MCHIFRGKRYEGVGYNIISVARGWVGVQFPGKKRYVTLEWPHIRKDGSMNQTKGGFFKWNESS